MAQDRDNNRFLVRMPDGMRDELKKQAAANNRSMNAEIVARLERSLLKLRDKFLGMTEEELRAEIMRTVEGAAAYSHMSEDLKAATKLAIADTPEVADKSTATFVEYALRDWLIGRGYLKETER